MKAIEISHVTKRYHNRLLLDDIELTIDEGEVYGVTGANGSGKSMLLRLIAGLERPDRGTIKVLGYDTLQHTTAARRSVGFLSDRQAALRGLTVIEQLTVIAELRGLMPGERKPAVDAMLELVDLAHLRDQQVTRLSRGQARRLALAAAMVHDPPIMLCDEPMEGLDANGYLEMREVLAELPAMGRTIVVASNNADDVARLCHRVGVLESGTLATRSVIGVLNDFRHEGNTDQPGREQAA